MPVFSNFLKLISAGYKEYQLLNPFLLFKLTQQFKYTYKFGSKNCYPFATIAFFSIFQLYIKAKLKKIYADL